MRTFEDTISDILDCGIVHNIGQFSKRDLALLNIAAKKGMISKGKGGEYSKVKTVFAPIGFDFELHRKTVIEKVRKLFAGEIQQKEWLKKFDYEQFVKLRPNTNL